MVSKAYVYSIQMFHMVALYEKREHSFFIDVRFQNLRIKLPN